MKPLVSQLLLKVVVGGKTLTQVDLCLLIADAISWEKNPPNKKEQYQLS